MTIIKGNDNSDTTSDIDIHHGKGHDHDSW